MTRDIVGTNRSSAVGERLVMLALPSYKLGS